jgi:hypothetical protein
LRFELADRAERYARARSLPHCFSYGQGRVVCFEPFGEGRHGNFYPSSYRAIQANAEWRHRLKKVHTTARKTLPPGNHGFRSELDSCMSSDALLMNVFCLPRVLRTRGVACTLGLETGAAVRFGYRARVPMDENRFDQTEVDMQIGAMLVEAKLTESDFQRAPKEKLLRYRDFRDVFDAAALPQDEGNYHGYQLIRNVLAAYDRRCAFCVLLDSRRGDLLEAWYAVMRCVIPIDLRTCCKVLTWQELSRTLPRGLQQFLAEKYGIG